VTEQPPRTAGAPSRAPVHDSTAAEPANASALIRNDAGHYLMHLRDHLPGLIWEPGAWSLLGGGREPQDRSLKETIRRELLEEAGLDLPVLEPYAVENATAVDGTTVLVDVYSGRWNGDPAELTLTVGVHLYPEDADGLVLLGLRHPESAYAGGVHHFLAGHCERESAVACLVREAAEEAGLVIDPADVEFAHAVHLIDTPQAQPRLQLVFRAHHWQGTPEVLEPDRCVSWDWWHPDALPEPIVPYARAAIRSIRAGVPYSELDWG